MYIEFTTLLGDGGKVLGDAGQKSKLLGDGSQILGAVSSGIASRVGPFF